MKRNTSFLRFFLIAAASAVLAAITLSGCASFYSVSIRTNGNVSSVLAGGSLILRSSGRDLEWKVSSTSDGSGPVANGTFITQNGVLTVDIYEPSSVLYIIVKSLRDNYHDIKQIRIVTVNTVAVTPVNEIVAVGRSLQFKAQVTGNNNPDNAVTWSVGANTAGTGAVTAGTSISSNGTLSVAANESLRTLYVIAASIIDKTKSGVTSVTVVVPTVTSVTVSAPSHSIPAGTSMQFTANVVGTYDPSKAVTWRVSSNAAGTGAVTPGTTINANGILSVASSESVSALFVFAASVVDQNKYGSISVAVTPAPVTVAPPPAPVAPPPAALPPTPPATTPPVTPPAATPPGNTQQHQNTNQQQSRNQPQRNQQQERNQQQTRNQQTQTPPDVTPPVVTPTPEPTPPVVTPPVTTPSEPNPVPTTPTVTGVSISPASVSTKTNTNVQLSATVSGTNNPSSSVTWKVGPNPDGSGDKAPRTVVSTSGRLTVAPNEWNPTLYVVAISTADTSKSAVIAVTITNNNANQGSNQGN